MEVYGYDTSVMECLEPLSIRRPKGRGAADRITVPCGKCAHCCINRRNEWSVRLREELRDSTFAHFVTLTYSDDQLVYNDLGWPSVWKDEMQRYLKRLRKHVPKVFRYYLVGEYGSNTQRPHYHILAFNCPDPSFYVEAWSDRGHVKVGSITDASIMYVCKYHVSKTDFPPDAEPSFVLMSRNPGIGSSYVGRMYDYHNPYSDRTYYPDSGSKRRLPRYYKNKLWNEVEREHLEYHIPEDIRSAKERIDQAVDATRRFKQKSDFNGI